MTTHSANQAIQDIKKHINYYDPLPMDELSNMLEDSNNIDSYIGYTSSNHYRKSHVKSQNDKLFEDEYFNKNLEDIADYLLEDYDNQNGKYAEYTLLSDYAMEQADKRSVPIDTSVDDNLEQGMAIHVDLLQEVKQEDNLSLSDRTKRNNRCAEVQNNLHKYPDLQQMYDEWEQMGYNYGLHSSYTKSEKKAIREHWFNKFKLEREQGVNPYSPANRLRLIREQYNDLGYNMHIALESLRNSTTPLNKFMLGSSHNGKNQTLESLEGILDITDYKHVKAILQIDKETTKSRVVGLQGVHNVINWYAIMSLLESKHKPSKRGGGISGALYDLYYAVELSDLEDYQRTIFNVIRQNEDFLLDNLSEYWVSCLLNNPYKMMIDYVKEIHSVEMDMRQLKSEINKIAKIVAASCDDIANGLSSKKCNTCGKDKLPNAYSGQRAVCKKCRALEQKDKAV